MNKKYTPTKCPVCRRFYFSELDEFEKENDDFIPQCFQCGWIYNADQLKDHHLVDVENGKSIAEYRKEYKKLVLKNPNYNYLEANYTPTPHLCPVCQLYMFPEEGSFDICTECGWEDDSVMTSDPEYEGGANDICLIEYIKRYKNIKEKNPRYQFKKDGLPE